MPSLILRDVMFMRGSSRNAYSHRVTRRNIVNTLTRVLTVAAFLVCVIATSASAGTLVPSTTLFSNHSPHDPWHVEWLTPAVAETPAAARLATPAPILLQQEAAQP